MTENNSVKISVIIPVFNTALYLNETIQSVLSQGISEFEIIAVDDGSTDDSLQILRTWAKKDSRIHVYSQPNQGQSVARNVALKHARGTYLYFMDSDDRLKSNCFSVCVKQMEKMNYDFLYFDGDILYEDKKSNICWNYHRTQHYQEFKYYSGVPLMESLLTHYAHRAVPWLLFIKRTYLEQLQLMFYPGIIHEDELFTVLLTLQSNRIGCCKHSLVDHRVRNNSTMTQSYSIRNVDCYLTVADELLRYGTKQSQDVLAVIHQYLKYTLSKVIYTAYVLPFRDKLKILQQLYNKKYFRYIALKSILVFLFKFNNGRSC